MAIRLLLAAAGLYLFFIVAPSVVAGLTIFRYWPSGSFEELTAPGAQFYPYRALLLPARDRLLAMPHREVTVDAPDGLALRAEYWPRGAARTAIFVHGYRSDPMLNFAFLADAFAREGCNRLLSQQRGHDARTRTLTGMGLREQYDVLRWNAWALSQPGVTSTVLCGASMGAATLAYASDKLDPGTTAALILDSGYNSPYEQIFGDCRKRHLPGKLMMPIIRWIAQRRPGVDLKAQTRTSLAKTSIPCFFLHGTEDLTVPYACGRSCYDACAARKAFFTAEGAGHIEAALAEPERAAAEIFAFISSSVQQEEHKP